LTLSRKPSGRNKISDLEGHWGGLASLEFAHARIPILAPLLALFDLPQDWGNIVQFKRALGFVGESHHEISHLGDKPLLRVDDLRIYLAPVKSLCQRRERSRSGNHRLVVAASYYIEPFWTIAILNVAHSIDGRVPPETRSATFRTY